MPVCLLFELLTDPRVNITLCGQDERPPLWWAAQNGHCEVVEWLIASGRELEGGKNKKGKEEEAAAAALEIARRMGKPDVVAVLERFRENPALSRQEIRHKFKCQMCFFELVAISFLILTVDNFIFFQVTSLEIPWSCRAFFVGRDCS